MPPRLPRRLLFALHLLLVASFTLQPLFAAVALAAPLPISLPALPTQEEPLSPEEAPVVWPIPSAEQPVNPDTPPVAVPLDGLFPPEELADPGPAPDPLVIPALPDVPLDLHIEADRYLVAPGETVVVTLSLFAAPEQLPVQATVHLTVPTTLRIVDSNAPAFPWSVETAALSAGAAYSLSLMTVAAEPGALPAVVELRLGATAPSHQARQVRHLLGLLPSPIPLPPDTGTPDTGIVDSAPLRVELGVQGTVLATADLAVLVPSQAPPADTALMAGDLPHIRYTPGYDALHALPPVTQTVPISETVVEPVQSSTAPVAQASAALSYTLRLPFVALASASPAPQPETAAMAAPADPPAAEVDLPTFEDNGVIFYRLWHLEAQGLTLAAAPALPESPDEGTEEMPADLAHPRFATPVLMMVDAAALAAQGVDMDIVQLWTRPDAGQDWQPVPGAAYDAARQVWIAWLTHFSDFGLGIAPSVSGELLPSLHGASSDLQTGAATFTYPIRVPAGPGGLAPSLSLNYSSLGPNDLFMALGSHKDRKLQSSVLGYGWGLGGLNTITRIQGEGTASEYLLQLNGQNYDINGSGTNGAGFYDTNPISFMAIDFIDNSTTSVWRIKTRDGTLYEFGGDPAESWPSGGSGERDNAFVEWNFRLNNTVKRHEIATWYLRRVTDAQGNTIEYNYTAQRAYMKNTSCEPSGIADDKRWYTRATRLTSIQWGGRNGAAHPLRVQLNYGPRTDTNVNDGCQARWTNLRLDSLSVEVLRSGAWQVLRQYELTPWYPTKPSSSTHTDFIRHLHLQKIEEYGNTGTNGAALPAYTFTYLMRLDQPTGAHADTENNIRLDSISNGQGGKITYSYIEQEPDCLFQDELCSNEYRWLVSKMHVEDGLGNYYDKTYNYDQVHVSTYGKRFLYLGASSATVTVYAPNSTSSVVRFEEHTFYRGSKASPSALLGQPQRLVVRNASGGTVYSDRRTTWTAWDRVGTSDSFTVNNTLANGTPRWVQFSRQEEWVQGRATQQLFYYHAADQGNKQYGNVTLQEERAPDVANVAWSDWDAWVNAGSLYPLRRSTQTRYMPNSSGPDAPELPYIVDRPARVLVKDGSGVCQAETRWVYASLDPVSAPNQNRYASYLEPPQTPLVVKQEQVVNGCPYDTATTGWYVPELLIHTYGYDAYGNRTMAVQHGDSAGQDIRIDTVYDSIYHRFPISQRYAANPAIEERVAYYGVNSSNEDAADFFWGQAAAYCTPNDVCTYYAYDDYGRLTRRWEQRAEGTTWAQLTDQNASAQLTYYAPGAYAGQATYIATEWRAPRCQGNFVRKHYDGLGRLVAEQRAYQNWSHAVDGCGTANQGQEIQVNYAYDALDQPVKTSVPRLVGRSYWSNPAIDWNTTPYSRTDYNPIGRITRQVAPNGEQTDFAYLGRAASIITAAQYGAPARTVGWQQDDPLDQPFLVRTYAWNGSSWVAQSQVQLSYSVTGNLTQVVYPGSLGTSTFTYDQAGRRTAMNDIDLGSWSYTYNRLGHLVRQRDARNQTLCFYADAIGRPLARYDNGTSATCPSAVPANAHVRYSYDGGHSGGVNASRGLLTQVTVREGSTAGTWSYTRDLSYSAQGLPQSETISYPNSVSFTTQTLYDAYLRPATLIYADGEQVTASYNGMGLVTKLTATPSGGAAQTLVDSVSYNEAGQLTALRMPIGGVLWRTQLYHPWNAASADSNARLMHIRVGTTNDPANDASHNKLWLGYQYEGFGNPRVLFEGSNNGAVVANPVSYDAQSRLSAAYGGSFGFDAVNRMSLFEGRSYSYGATHPQALLTSSKSGTATLDFTYDANGNLTQRQYLDGAGAEQTQTLAWDAANHLRTVTQGTTVETYWYDEAGQRVRKQRGSVLSYYPNRYHEREGSAVTKVYYLGELPIGLRAVGSSTVTYLHTDALGSVVLTTQGQTITGSRWYRAYGAKRSGNDFSFEQNYTGQRLDDTGLLYYGARYYDPAAGRFLSPDTLIPDPSNPLDYNRYLYARGNPLKYNDPTGHCALSAVAGPMGLVADIPCWIAEGAVAAGAAVATVGGVAGAVGVIGFVLGEPELNYPPPFPAHDQGQLTESFPLPGATTLTIEGVPLVAVDAPSIHGVEPVENPSMLITTYSGGRFGSLSTGNGIERHHMPANDSNPWPTRIGPAIQMDRLDHYQTSSWGPSAAAAAYRQQLQSLIAVGRVEEAIQMEISDIRSKFGDKYDNAIREMLNYAVKEGFIPSE